MRIERIVVGLDGSRNSDLAAEAAAGLAEATGAEVVAVHAVGLLEDLARDGHTPAERREVVRHDLETVWTDLLRRTGIRVRCEIRDGHPVDALLTVVHDEGADLLVIGSRGLGRVSTELLGSTSAAMARQSPCPVLLVPDRPPS